MNHPELLDNLNAVQGVIWPTVSNSVSEMCDAAVQMNSPLVVDTLVEDAVQEFSAANVVVQFSFAGQPGSFQALVLPLDTVAALAGGELEAVDEGALDEVRGPLESIVQGICLALGNARNDVVVASDVNLRVGRFARPSSLQPTDTLVRIQVAVGTDSSIGSLAWLMDPATAHFVAGLTQPTASASASQTFNPLPPFGASSSPSESHGLDILMDVPLEISVELGRTRMVVKEVVDLGVGSIVEIEKSAGEPVDILVNGRLVARGEVVVIEDNFGVRITEIMNPRERLVGLAA